MQPRLSLRHVSKDLPDGSGRLLDVSLDAQPGERVALVGGDGGDRTLLLTIAVGLEAPAAGEVLLDGAPVDEPGAERALVPARAPLFPWMTAHENIAYAVGGQDGAGEPDAWLSLLGLERIAGALPRELEPTDRHGVALGRALAVRPRLLAVDEPHVGGDGFSFARWHDMLARALDADAGLTALLALRAPDELGERAQRVLELRDGRVGAPAEEARA